MSNMKWSINKSGGVFFVVFNGVRGLTSNGQPNVIQSASAGKDRHRIHLRYTEGPGQSLNRTEFDSDDNPFAEKLQFVKTNAEFLHVLESAGITILRRPVTSRHQKKTCTPMYRNLEPVPAGDVTDDAMKKIHQKCIGQKMIPVDCLGDTNESGRIRPFSNSWKRHIKKSLTQKPAETIVRIPVHENIEGNGMYTVLNGHHVISAVKEILAEEDQEIFQCLREVSCDVYKGLDDEEKLYIGAWYQQRCNQKKTTFQDRVYLAKKVLESGGDKEDVRKSLSVLDGKCYTIQSLGTVLSVGRYSDPIWIQVQELFNSFEENQGYDASFPEPACLL